MKKLKKEINCKEVENLLVDYCEDTLKEDLKIKIEDHIKACNSCKKELDHTKNLLTTNKENLNDEYFEKLSEKIENKILKDSDCERAQNYIIDLISGNLIPTNMKEHIESCKICKNELNRTKKMIENIKDLHLPLPNEAFFSKQFEKIDKVIDQLPSHRLSENKHNLKDYIYDLTETLKLVILRPTTAMAASLAIIFLFVFGRYYHNDSNIEGQSIQLSEAIQKSDIAATEETYIGHSISAPSEDESLEVKALGTAKKENKNNKVN